MRLTGALRAGLAYSRNAIRYSQASDRYGVVVQLARNGFAVCIFLFKRFVQVSPARPRVVAGDITAAIAHCRLEEYITASRIKIHFMTL